MKCPRCDSETIKTISTSPVPDVWEYYGCTTCQYSWRSTEHPVVHGRFKIKPEDIDKLPILPPIPPLEK